MKLSRSIATLALALLVAAPLAAQGPPGPPPGGPQGGPSAGGPPSGGPHGISPAQALKDILGLSDEQLASVKTLAETRDQAAQGLQKQLDAAQKALNDALRAKDAAAVAAALVKLDALRTQLEAIQDTYRVGVEALLTSDQRTKLQAIRETAAALRAVEALRPTGLV